MDKIIVITKEIVRKSVPRTDTFTAVARLCFIAFLIGAAIRAMLG